MAVLGMLRLMRRLLPRGVLVAAGAALATKDLTLTVGGDPTYQLLPQVELSKAAEDLFAKHRLPSDIARHIAGVEQTTQVTVGLLADLNVVG